MKFRPLHDRVLVERVEQEEKTAGGIILPDTAQEKPMEGKVVAAGSGSKAEDGKVTPLVAPGFIRFTRTGVLDTSSAYIRVIISKPALEML